MTREQYIALIKARLDKHVTWNVDAGDGGTQRTGVVNQALAEDLAAYIWSPEEVARAAQELSVNGGISFEQAVKALGEFVEKG
jgi:D-serine deaminase-like pyridoxal phosphate-dependent protein